MTMLRRSKRPSGARLLEIGLALVILIGSAVGHQAQPAFAAYGNPAVVGPMPAAGTIRVYVLQNPNSSVPRTTVVDGGNSATHDGSGVFDLLHVKTGDHIDVYLYNLGHGGPPPDPGWEDPPSHWNCGSGHPVSGILDFSSIESAAEAAGAPVLSRECWEDWADPGYEDVAVIVSFNPATVDTTPPTTTATPSGTTAIGAATDTPTPADTATPMDTATVFVPSPVPATYEPLPTATRPAPMVAVAPVLPSEPRLNMGLVLAAMLCLTSAIFAAYLTSRIDPRPQAVRNIASLLEKQQRFPEGS